MNPETLNELLPALPDASNAVTVKQRQLVCGMCLATTGAMAASSNIL
jgi:hypothetical protein